jgi:CRP/FNR family cyclic AMP-dependent transcriptional regulator
MGPKVPARRAPINVNIERRITLQGMADSALPAELIEEFARQGSVKAVPRNALVVQEGEPADALYLVLEGTLAVYVDDESGRVAELARLGPGQYFGELMLGSAVRTASVRALGAARLCVIRRAEFEGILRRRPDLAFHVIQTLIGRVKALTESVRGLALMDVYGRVARLLLQSAKGAGREIGLSQQAIAERVGASRSMVNRILKDLAVGGYIELGRGRITLRRGLPKRW